MRGVLGFWRVSLLAAGLTVLRAGPDAMAEEFSFPAACTPTVDCYVQMLPDIEPGPGAVDPFCGSVTRDGYPGTDIRLQSLADIGRGVNVLSIADGIVVEARDGMDDRLVLDDRDLAGIEDRHCGNGLAIDHGDGLVSHYCHLRKGSIPVRTGMKVNRGMKIGEIGASGMARYPKLHVSVMRNGAVRDLFTGLGSGEICGRSKGRRAPEIAGFKSTDDLAGDTQILGAGLSDTVPDRSALAVYGPPPVAGLNARLLVAWGWFINLHHGDRVRLTLFGPAGGVVATETSLPARALQREMTVHAGRRGRPAPGKYRVLVELLRDGKPVRSSEKSVDITG